MSALAERKPHVFDRLVTPDWPLEMLVILRDQLCPKGIPDWEFMVFVKKCQATGLNPLIGEAFCIPRKVKNADGVEVQRYVFESSYEGMRARAGRFGDFLSVDGGAVCAQDPTSLIDVAGGKVQHVFEGSKTLAQRGGLTGAWGRVRRRDGSCVVTWLPHGSRTAGGPVWGKDPGGHLAKCAKVQALRETYPVAFDGVYAREEMAEADEAARVSAVLDAAPPVAVAVPTAPPPKVVVGFGEFRATPLESLSDEQLASVLAEGRAKEAEGEAAVVAGKKALWLAHLKRRLAAIEGEMSLRARALPEPQESETDRDLRQVQQRGEKVPVAEDDALTDEVCDAERKRRGEGAGP